MKITELVDHWLAHTFVTAPEDLVAYSVNKVITIYVVLMLNNFLILLFQMSHLGLRRITTLLMKKEVELNCASYKVERASLSYPYLLHLKSIQLKVNEVADAVTSIRIDIILRNCIAICYQ